MSAMEQPLRTSVPPALHHGRLAMPSNPGGWRYGAPGAHQPVVPASTPAEPGDGELEFRLDRIMQSVQRPDLAPAPAPADNGDEPTMIIGRHRADGEPPDIVPAVQPRQQRWVGRVAAAVVSRLSRRGKGGRA